MKKDLNILVITLLLLLPSIAKAQWIPDELLSSSTLSESDSNKFVFAVDMNGFFKNNEYFSPIAKGRTLPGINFLPKVGYQFGTQFRAELGAYNVYYSGDQQKEGVFAFNSLFVRLQYAATPNLNLVFGNIYGGLNHQLIEPLYQWERHLINKPESGLQLIYKDDRYLADVWVNWQRYIEHGDSVPEILTFGISTSARLTRPESRLRVTVPLQLLIYHQGGQIDTSDDPMIVMGNAVTGICSEWLLEKSVIRSIEFDTYLAGYYDKLPNKPVRPYTGGWGIYPVLKVNRSLFSLMTGYWYAKNFYALEGESLFGSFNPYAPEQTNTHPQISYRQTCLRSTGI